MKGMLTNGNSGEAHRVGLYLQGIGSMALFQDDIVYGTAICNSDGISRN
jgi:hypothetical protein